MFTRFSSMREAYINYINKINLECFRLHLELYINLISGVYVRLNVIRNCAKFIGDSELQNYIANLQRHVHTAIEEGKRCLESKSHNKDGI